MSDKSEIEAIRAVKRYNPCDIKARNGFDLDSELVLAADYDRLLSHVDALEARVARVEGALRRIEYKLSARNPETQVKANEALWLLLFSDIQKITRAALVSKEQP